MGDRGLRDRGRALFDASEFDLAVYQQQLVRSGGDELLLVYRTAYENPSCKRVTRFPDFDCALQWIRHHWSRALSWDDSAEEENYERAQAVTAGRVEGLSGVFGGVAEKRIPSPASWEELATHLGEGSGLIWGEVKVEAPVVSALVDDDDLDLAFYLLPLTYALERPNRSAFMLHGDWRLPAGFKEEGGFEPEFDGFVEVQGTGSGSGTLYVVDMSVRVTTYLKVEAAEAVSRVQRLRVPALVSFLRDWEEPSGPPVLLALKAALADEDETLERAAERCALHDIEELDVLAMVAGSPEEEDWGIHEETLLRSRSHWSPHFVQAVHWDGEVFHQWFVFDDSWGSANQDLAQSLLWYASDWDPFR